MGEKEKQKITRTPFFEGDDFLAEEVILCFSKLRIPAYLKYSDGKIEFLQYFKEIGNSMSEEFFIPTDGKELESEAVIFPEFTATIKHGEDGGVAFIVPVKELGFGTFQELLADIRKHIHTYCDITPEFERVAAWYVLLTWFYDQLDTIPYLRVLGPPGTGKTRFLRVLSGLCYRSMKMDAVCGSAPIFRAISKWKGTLFLNEADFQTKDEKDDIFRILNGGFERSGVVWRCEGQGGGGQFKLVTFSTFCPKVIATRFHYQDSALESRCLTEEMKETKRAEIKLNLPHQYYREQADLRFRLLSARLLHYGEAEIDPERANALTEDMDRRLAQGFSAFAALSSFLGEGMDQEFREMAQEFQIRVINARSETLEGAVVLVLQDFLKNAKPLLAKEIAAKLKEDGDYPLNKDKIGKRLRGLGAVPEHRRIEGKTERVWEFPEDVWKSIRSRYIPKDMWESLPDKRALMGDGQYPNKAGTAGTGLGIYDEESGVPPSVPPLFGAGTAGTGGGVPRVPPPFGAGTGAGTGKITSENQLGVPRVPPFPGSSGNLVQVRILRKNGYGECKYMEIGEFPQDESEFLLRAGFGEKVAEGE